jgi:hypothetical protein
LQAFIITGAPVLLRIFLWKDVKSRATGAGCVRQAQHKFEPRLKIRQDFASAQPAAYGFVGCFLKIAHYNFSNLQLQTGLNFALFCNLYATICRILQGNTIVGGQR